MNPQTSEFYFLEINPRLQVEHTVTESMCSIDIVQAQLTIAQGASLQEADMRAVGSDVDPPPLHSIQLRITAEDPEKNWSLSVGKIKSFHFPTGNGIRVDTNLVSGASAAVTADFDSLIAKLIITASTWEGVLRKAARALQDTRITGIQTNVGVLRAIISHTDFVSGRCDTTWLESNQEALLAAASELDTGGQSSSHLFSSSSPQPSSALAKSNSSTLFRAGDAWSINLTPHAQSEQSKSSSSQHHLSLTKVLQNDFPHTLSANITFNNEPCKLVLNATSSSFASLSSNSKHRRADRGDRSHLAIPVSGTLVEVLVDEGDYVQKDECVAVVRQMKMELEVRAHRQGRVEWIMEVEDGKDVGEGILAAVIVDEGEVKVGREAKL